MKILLNIPILINFIALKISSKFKEFICVKQIRIAIKIPTSPIFVVRKALMDAKQDFSSSKK